MKNCVRLSKTKMHSMCHQPELRLRSLAFGLSTLLLLSACSELPIQVAKQEPQVKVEAIAAGDGVKVTAAASPVLASSDSASTIFPAERTL